MVKEFINNNSITYNISPGIHIKEYYNYCLSLLKDVLSNTDNYINIIFGENNKCVINNNTYKIDIQCEHTLVKFGEDLLKM